MFRGFFSKEKHDERNMISPVFLTIRQVFANFKRVCLDIHQERTGTSCLFPPKNGALEDAGGFIKGYWTKPQRLYDRV